MTDTENLQGDQTGESEQVAVTAGVPMPRENATPDVVDADTEDADTEPADAGDDEPRPGAEAARYRRRLRETEKQRDTLAARVEALQRQQVEALLARERMTPKALWATTELADLVGDDGLVDPALVKQAAQAARAELGITSGLHVPAEGKIPPPPPGDRFTAAFKPKR